MSKLPPGWELPTIGELIELNPKNTCDDKTEVGFVPMPLLGTSYRKKMGFENKQWNAVKKGYTHFANGDVLLAKITPCFENGKAGLAQGLPNGIGAGSTEFFVCRPRTEALESKYLLAFFKTERFVKAGAVEMTGSVGHKRVPKSYLTETKIPLAPLPEQKRIADKLDTVLTRVDACRERLNRVPLILKRFRQSVLATATSGQLTADWREERDTSSPHKETDNLSRWINTDVQSVAAVGTGSTPLRSNPAFFANEGVAWITSAATGEQYVSQASEYVTDSAIKAHRLKRYPVGTILVAMYGEGKTRGQVSELAIEATINQACAAIVVDETKASRAFVKLALQANYLEMRQMAEGGNQPNLNLSKIKEFKLPLPLVDEQHEIVRRVETLFAFADCLEARLGSVNDVVNTLTPALLAKAFRGELVPQDPNDEPAIELLKRLAATRESVPKAKRRGKPASADAS